MITQLVRIGLQKRMMMIKWKTMMVEEMEMLMEIRSEKKKQRKEKRPM